MPRRRSLPDLLHRIALTLEAPLAELRMRLLAGDLVAARLRVETDRRLRLMARARAVGVVS